VSKKKRCAARDFKVKVDRREFLVEVRVSPLDVEEAT
jgi:hypothetical protein